MVDWLLICSQFKFCITVFYELKQLLNTVQAIELKKLQTPLYEEFYNTLNATESPNVAERAHDENVINYLKLPPKSRSPSRPPTGSPSTGADSASTASPGSCGRRMSNVGNAGGDQTAQDTPSPQCNDWKGLLVDAQQEPNSPRLVHCFHLIMLSLLLWSPSEIGKYSACSVSFSEIQRKWKEELDQELERKRGICLFSKIYIPLFLLSQSSWIFNKT